MASKNALDEFISHAGNESRAVLAEKASRHSLDRGQYVFFDGDDADALYLVESGVIEANVVHHDGKLYIFHFLFPGDLFGVGAAFGVDFVPFSSVVRKDAEYWRIARSDLLPVIESDPELVSHLLDVFGEKLYSCYLKERCIAGERVENRVVCILLKTANEQGLDPECSKRVKLDQPLTNRDISGLIGSTEETVSRIMSRLKKEGIIGTENKHIVVKEPETLRGLLTS